MKKIIFLLITVNCFSQAPTIEWQKSIGGTATDLAIDMKQTNDGGYITIGSTLSDDFFIGENYHGNFDIYVVKTNSAGIIEWQKTIGGSAYDVGASVQQTSDNGYILAGYTSSNDGDIVSNHGAFDCLVIKLDANGDLVWKNTYGGSAIENAFNIIQVPDGGYIFSGHTSSIDGQITANHGLADAWIVKLDASGTIEWQQTLGGSETEFINEIKPTSDNGYVIVGHTNSNNGDIVSNHGQTDAWVVKLNTSGGIVWEKTFGGLADDYLYSIIPTIDGGFIASGQTESNDGDFVNNHGNADAWVIKLTQDGLLDWQKIYGGSSDDSANIIKQTSDGNYILGAQTVSEDGDVIMNHGNQDVWIVKINIAGTILWQKNYGGSNYDGISSLVRTTDTGFAFSASSSSNDGDVIANAGSTDLWLVKLSAEALKTNSFYKETPILYPIPAISTLHIKMPSENKIDLAVITDVTGKIVLRQNQDANRIDIQNLASGLYMLEVISNGQSFRSKFTKQ